jgi:hypothetical protein
MTATTPPLADIHLLQIPIPIWAKTQEHIDELLREFTLIAAQRSDDREPPDVPVRLMALIDELTNQYGGLNTDQENRLAQAAEMGVVQMDLTYHVPYDAAEACRRLETILGQADAYCRAGTHLLTLATPPELATFLHWFLEEFVHQLDGKEPTPFPDYQA